MKNIIFLICFFSCGLSLAQEKIYIQNPAVFIEGGSIRDSVRDECELEPYLGKQTFLAISRVIENTVSTSNTTPPNDAALLTLSILAVQGHGGVSAYTGGKSMTVRADYKVAGQILATKTLTIGSRGGFFGGFKGICSVLERDADAIAKQIAAWLQKLPSQQVLMAGRQMNMATATEMSGVSPKEIIYLISPVVYGDDNRIRQSVKDECALPALAETYILERANSEKYPVKSLSPYKRKGVAMNVSITDVEGGSMRFAGDKLIKMHVDLLKDGDVIGSKDFEAKTINGVTAGSCLIFEQLVRSIATDSVKWAIGQISPEAGSGSIEKQQKIN